MNGSSQKDYETAISALSPISLLSEPLEAGGTVGDALSCWGYEVEENGRIVTRKSAENREGDE